jgi:hypothetical protein
MEAGGEATKKSKEKAQGFALRWENFSKVFWRGVCPMATHHKQALQLSEALRDGLRLCYTLKKE